MTKSFHPNGFLVLLADARPTGMALCISASNADGAET